MDRKSIIFKMGTAVKQKRDGKFMLGLFYLLSKVYVEHRGRGLKEWTGYLWTRLGP